MQIECILKREGGTFASIDGVTYHFAPQADGSHVADVTIEAHIDRFLSISEGYRLYRPKVEAPVTGPKPDPGRVDGDLDGDGDADRDDLVIAYQQKFGRKPHGRWSADKIRAALAETPPQ